MTDTENAPGEPGSWGAPAGGTASGRWPANRNAAAKPGGAQPAAVNGGGAKNGGAAANGPVRANSGVASNGGVTANDGAAGNGGVTANGGAAGNGGGSAAQVDGRAQPGPAGVPPRPPGPFQREAGADLPGGVGHYQRGANVDQRPPYERRSFVPQPAPDSYQTVPTRGGPATTGLAALRGPSTTGGAPARIDRRPVRVGAPPLGTVARSRRVQAGRPLGRPAKPRRVRLVEKFGGRRLRHHASFWRRIRSFVGILLIGLLIAAIIATVIAVIVGAIALAVQHALH